MDSGRIRVRKLRDHDFDYLKNILQNDQLMKLGWGKTYSEVEVSEWLKKINNQYTTSGYSYFAVENELNQFIGIAGLIPTVILDKEYIELAYIVDVPYQGKGYATEAAAKLIYLGFNQFDIKQVIAQFVPENISSKKVAEKMGLTYSFSYEREQNDISKKHLVYIKNK